MALIGFVIIVNSYESISNKTVGLAQFIVLMLVMFHRTEPVRLAFGGGNRTRIRSSTLANERVS